MRLHAVSIGDAVAQRVHVPVVVRPERRAREVVLHEPVRARGPRIDVLRGRRRDPLHVVRRVEVVRRGRAVAVTAVDLGLVRLLQRAGAVDPARGVGRDLDVDPRGRHRRVARVELAVAQQRLRAERVERTRALALGAVDAIAEDPRERAEVGVVARHVARAAAVVHRVHGHRRQALEALAHDVLLGLEQVIVDVPAHRVVRRPTGRRWWPARPRSSPSRWAA